MKSKYRQKNYNYRSNRSSKKTVVISYEVVFPLLDIGLKLTDEEASNKNSQEPMKFLSKRSRQIYFPQSSKSIIIDTTKF